MFRLLVLATMLAGCDVTGEIWEAATRNSRYRRALEVAIEGGETNLERLENEHQTLLAKEAVQTTTHTLGSSLGFRVSGLRGLGGLGLLGGPPPRTAAVVKHEIESVRAHLDELKRERAEISGNIRPERRRCPVHGDWMYREVVATASSYLPGPGSADLRISEWKYPYYGGPAHYSNTQYLPYTRPWICRSCQEAHAHWLGVFEEHSRGSYPPTDEHVAIEVVLILESNRHCRNLVERFEHPFFLDASFTVQPDGSLDALEFEGSEHVVGTPMTDCFLWVFAHTRVASPPPEPVEIRRLRLWTEI